MAYSTKYCLDPLDVRRLRYLWLTKVQYDSTFQDFDDFLLWSSDWGYAKGMYIWKRNDAEPHSRENSYFWTTGVDYQQPQEEPEEINTCSFCHGCEKSCTHSMGCKDWKTWWINQWNKNISISPKLRNGIHSRKTFQYEHPDLIREGIV